MKLQILSIDVWGNAKDGFELNNWRDSGIRVEVDELADHTDIIKAIRRACSHRASAKGYHAEATESTFNVFRNNGKPAYFCNILDGQE
jgi:hypothetical protein